MELSPEAEKRLHARGFGLSTGVVVVTSVKDIRVEVAPTARRLGRGSFVFTDDYSVFDWGKMPDPIPHKGASLCTMGAFNFESLEDAGIPTHYRGVVDDGDVVGLESTSAPANEMAIDLTRVPDLPYVGGAYDYEAYHDAGGENYLVPLEIVFRNTVPVGSSLRRRTAPSDWGIGVDEWPDRDVDLDEPIIEFSTKYEERDRYLSREEAAAIAGTADIDRLADVARRVNEIVTDRAAEVRFTHQDGKIECLYVDGEIRVADVVGTFDENRFSYDGQQVSKEVLRQYYKREYPDWVEAVNAAKTEADTKGVADWRSVCDVDPPGLPDHVVEAAGHLYAAGANAYTGRDWFDVPSIEAAVDRVRAL